MNETTVNHDAGRRGKMSRKRKIVMFLSGFAILGLLLLFHFKQRDSYKCSICQSYKHVYQWRVGLWWGWSAPLTPKWEEIEKSEIRKSFFDENHEDSWLYAHGNDRNHFSELYESVPCTRAFIAQKIKAGELRKEIVRKIVAVGLGPDRRGRS